MFLFVLKRCATCQILVIIPVVEIVKLSIWFDEVDKALIYIIYRTLKLFVKHIQIIKVYNCI